MAEAQAKKHNAVITGSVIIQAADGSHRNRLLWARPDGEILHYDKRHLFRMAGEHKHYTPGERQVQFELKAGGFARLSATTCASRCGAVTPGH